MVSFALSLLLAATPSGGGTDITDYRVRFATATLAPAKKLLVVIRDFSRGGQHWVLAADPSTLETRILTVESLEIRDEPWISLRNKIRKTPYGKALAQAEKTSALLQDAGVTHSLPSGKGVVLTVDLCPSVHPLDRGLFGALLTDFEPEEKPVPVGIAITGVWIEEHPQDLAWVQGLEKRGDITVTWINHSYNHRYDKSLPLSRNFLLEKGTDPEFEILATEKAMIEKGLLPSVFFRFPGLVSSRALVSLVIGHALVPVGSDAWLAKNQQPSFGSIVLVHGNGNEPVGIEKFIELVYLEGKAIRKKDWLLFDLRESIAKEEEEQP